MCPYHYRHLAAPKPTAICSDPECDQVARSRGWCGTHYTRQRLGQPMGLVERRVTHRAGEPCAGPECPHLSVKRGLCGSHYAQERAGKPLAVLAYTRSSPRVCTVCGVSDWPPNGLRVCCSARCFALKQKYGDALEKERPCARCGEIIDLSPGAKGRKKQSNATLMCKTCRAARHLRHKMSVNVLARRDGTDCSICHEPVDMTLRKPSLFGPSVDHVIPYARGGTHDPENLALAHLWCNQVKQAQLNFKI